MAILLPSFFLSWIAMFLLYWKIWREANMHTRRMNLSVIPNIAEKNDRKSVQVMMTQHFTNRRSIELGVSEIIQHINLFRRWCS